MVHDVGHDGFNNVFHKNALTDRAVAFNDQSIQVFHLSASYIPIYQGPLPFCLIHINICILRYIMPYIHTRMHTYMNMSKHAHTYIHTYIHTHIHTYMHTCMRAYKHGRAQENDHMLLLFTMIMCEMTHHVCDTCTGELALALTFYNDAFVQHDSFILCETHVLQNCHLHLMVTTIHVCDIFHPCMWHDSYMWHDSCMWHDSSICLTWLFRVCHTCTEQLSRVPTVCIDAHVWHVSLIMCLRHA